MSQAWNRRKKSAPENPYLYAIRLLSRRDYSSEELRRKLEARGVAEDEVSLLLERLCAEGVVDDFRYGTMVCSHLIERGYGPLYIVNALRKKGIGDHGARILADAENTPHILCSSVSDGTEEGDLGEDSDNDKGMWVKRATAVVRYFERTRWHASVLNNMTIWCRALSLLQRRGFSGDVVRAVLGAAPRQE